ncbi:MAG: hypothetical protein KI792_06525 [Alphaproteobacteria bacterium]|nr:hypothetical protein [Alphaproteobacteria bacterium SS10]
MAIPQTPKSRNVAVYQIRRNPAGDFLFIFPADNAVTPIERYKMVDDDLVLIRTNGRQVRLLELPDSLMPLLRQKDQIRVVEERGGQPVGDHNPKADKSDPPPSQAGRRSRSRYSG